MPLDCLEGLLVPLDCSEDLLVHLDCSEGVRSDRLSVQERYWLAAPLSVKAGLLDPALLSPVPAEEVEVLV